MHDGKNFFAVRVKSNSIRRALRTPRLKAEGSSVSYTHNRIGGVAPCAALAPFPGNPDR